MDPEVWRWIWLATAATFIIGEIATAAFFLLPFGVGAAAAAAVAVGGANATWQWLAFLLVSVAAFAAIQTMARRTSRTRPVGADRLVGETGVVVTDLSPDPEHLGTVRIGREEWHAETPDRGHLPAGTSVEVVRIEGTRAVVRSTH
ncbi:MAG: NfeD family protein [Acidimicrobiales bacterium]|nr:NfeD family protein [Acidimicrobiales bacterium]